VAFCYGIVKSAKLLKNILFSGFSFIREGVVRWKSIHGLEYLNAQRRIRFLHSAPVIEQMKETLKQTNEDTQEFGYLWKPPKVRFLESLPKL
jgi:hypothetical protein